MELTHRTLGVRRTAAIVAATAVAALAIPAAANAAVDGVRTSATTATLTGDEANDNIAISVSGDNLSHNLTGNGFNSSIDFDNVAPLDQTVPAATGRLTIDGGAGDDIIVGGKNLDTLRGGDGDDRLTGGPNNAAKPAKESISGGLGNDVMIWNNGDGDDVNDGGDGADETLFNNGTADDVMSVAPLAGSPGAHRFNRVGASIEIDIAATTERLNINSFSGADTLTSAAGTTLSTTIDAGPGNDTITTGDGADVVQGGTGIDTLNGGAGGDRILGNPGNDTMNGNAGDDTLVWNNGDGNDQMNGDDGLDKIENNLGAANDISALSVLNGKVHYARTNNPFTLDVASSEVFELNTFGGDDTLTTGPGLGALIAVVADAGSGNDTFTGGDEVDSFFGGLGNDTLDTGAGIGDLADGQDGDDTLKVRDNAADLARGGAGTDSATADAEDILVDVENKDVTAVPAADTKGTAARVRSRRITSKLKKGVYTAKIRVECPASEAGGCTKGVLALQTARTVSLGGTKFRAIVASKRYTLKAGQRKTLSVKLPKGVRALSRRGTLSVNAITTNRDAAGNLAQRSSRLAIKLVR